MTNNTDLIKSINESANRQFTSLAFYDKHMDCIRIELRDCSAFERRLNSVLTIAYDNYPEPGQSKISGITIKGVKHFFTEWNLPLEGIHLVADLLDRIVKELKLDEGSDADAIQSIKFIVSSIEMPVNLGMAA